MHPHSLFWCMIRKLSDPETVVIELALFANAYREAARA